MVSETTTVRKAPQTKETVSATGDMVRRASPEGGVSPGDTELANRLALTEAELRAMEDMLGEVR
jgi:hypothetical protein